MKKLIVLLFLFISFSSFADINNLNSGKIKGSVIDFTSNQPMEYVTVAVYNKKDSTLVTGGISNKDGLFEIKGLDNGAYYVTTTFVGYNKKTFNDIEILSNKNYDLGKIILNTNSSEISEVKVVADRQRIEYKIDKKIINVTQDINAAGGTAIDVLENTPSVEVDIDGNVALRGSSSFTVLIDGKPSVLSGSDALRTIPAATIQNIEIITNPSAKYEPTGSAGIINIIMKQNSLIGLTGIVNVTSGTGDKYGSDATFNYKTKNVNLLFGADWSDNNSLGRMYSERKTTFADSTQNIISDGTRNMIRGGYNIKGGADFYLSDKTTLTIFGTTGKYNFDMNGNSNIYESTLSNSNIYDNYMINTNLSSRQGNVFSSNLSLQHKFNKSGTNKLDILLYASNRNGDDFETQNEFISDSYFKTQQNTLQQIRTVSGDNSNGYRLKIDYVTPIGINGKIETGWQSLLDRENETYKFENFDVILNNWVNNELFSSNMNFKNNIHAGYFTWSDKIGKFQYMTGLRGEYTDRYIKNMISPEPSILQKFDLFPTIHVSYDVDNSTQLMSSYSKRIRRPDGRDLDPFASYVDQYTIRIGNPNLKPEYTDSYELQILRRFGSSFISLDGFYRKTNNLMTRTQELRSDGIMYMSTSNINNDYSTGVELMGNINFTKWFLLNTSLSVYDYRIKGTIAGENVDRESTNYSLKGNATIKFSSNSRVQFMSMFRGPSVSSQGETSSMFFSNLSYKQDFLNHKLVATVSVKDIFNSMKMENKSYTTNYYSYTKMTREPRVFQLTLSYSINNYKVNKNSPTEDSSMEIEY